MISFIYGVISDVLGGSAIIDVGGIGYEIHIPVERVGAAIEVGTKYKFYTSVVYREDSQTIYGFLNKNQRDFFKILVEKVSGVGPKLALTILNYFEFHKLLEIIDIEAVDELSECPGIGKKTAKKMLLDLKGNLKSLNATAHVAFNKTTSSVHEDALMALISLGCTKQSAEKLLSDAEKVVDKRMHTVETLLSAALKLKAK